MEKELFEAVSAFAQVAVQAAIQALVTVAVGRPLEVQPLAASRSAKHFAKEGTGACDVDRTWEDFLRSLAVWSAVASGIVLTSPILISSFMHMEEEVGLVGATGATLLSTAVAALASHLVHRRGTRP